MQSWSSPRQCSEHQTLMNEEINAWEAYDGLKLALENDPAPPDLAEELERRHKKATEASEEVKYYVVCVHCAGHEQVFLLRREYPREPSVWSPRLRSRSSKIIRLEKLTPEMAY